MSQQIAPGAFIRTQRIIWAAVLIGELVFLVVVASLIRNKPFASVNETIREILVYLAAGILAAEVSIALVIRSMLRRRARDLAELYRSCTTGNILLWAACEMPAFVALVGVMLSGQLWPGMAIVLIAMSIQAMSFPLAAPELRRRD